MRFASALVWCPGNASSRDTNRRRAAVDGAAPRTALAEPVAGRRQRLTATLASGGTAHRRAARGQELTGSGKGDARLLTIGQAAELLGVHPLTIRNWSEKGTIRCLRTPGGHRRFRMADLRRVLAAPQDDPATAAAIAELARGAVRDALAGAGPSAPGALPSGSSVVRGLRAELSANQRRSMTHLGRELLGLLIRYAVAHAAGGRAGPARREPEPGEDAPRRARQLGASYGRAARRLGLAPADVVATFNFFQETVVQALVECQALDYSRLSRLFGVALLAAVTAASTPPANPQSARVTHP